MIQDGLTLSVVIPCFNYGRYVGDAVESVLAQTWKDLEVIVVDGGSTDGETRALLERADWPKTRVFLREGRHYAGDNRNYGIERAKGRYVCCLDADDTLQPTYLEKALFWLESGEWDVVSAAAHSFGAESRYYGVPESVEAEALAGQNVVVTAAVFRRSLWEHVGGYQDFGMGESYVWEDWHFWVKCATVGARMRNLSREALINYRVHGKGSLSRQYGVLRGDEHQRRVIHEDIIAGAWKSRPYQADEISGIHRCLRSSVGDLAGAVMVILPFLDRSVWKLVMEPLGNVLAAAGHSLVTVSTDKALQELRYADEAEPWGVDVHRLPLVVTESMFGSYLDMIVDSRGISLILVSGSAWWEASGQRWLSRRRGIRCEELRVPGLDRLVAAGSGSLTVASSEGLLGDAYGEWIELALIPGVSPQRGARGTEVWVLDIAAPDGRILMYPELRIALARGWRLLISEGSPRGFAVVSEGVSESWRLYLPRGSVITFLQHAYSGSCCVRMAQSEQILDLFSEKPGHHKVTIPG